MGQETNLSFSKKKETNLSARYYYQQASKPKMDKDEKLNKKKRQRRELKRLFLT